MRTFTCGKCGQLVFFDNTLCLHCGSSLGFEPTTRELGIFSPSPEDGTVGELGKDDFGAPVGAWFRCGNFDLAGCNWMVPEDAWSPGALCESCVLTRTRASDEDPAAIAEFVLAEAAKRWLLFGLGELGLPIVRRGPGAPNGLCFDLLSSSERKVITGHDNGVITLDLAEADDAHREALRRQLSEPYRTLLGHFRHEIGHYFFTVLVAGTDAIAGFRALFGDETQSYEDAVSRHYETLGSSDAVAANQPELRDFVSRYATMHPHEDWAETFAHYLHIVDTLQTASSFNLTVAPPVTDSRIVPDVTDSGFRPFSKVVEQWLPFTYALNQINRSMGREDLYPFVLGGKVIAKLTFVHDLIGGNR